MYSQNETISILQAVEKLTFPAGASYLCKELNYSQATIGRILLECERDGLLEKVSNKGRTITAKGREVLKSYHEKEKLLTTANNLIQQVGNATKHDLLEILEVRKLLEVKTCEEACKHATDEEISELKGILFDYLRARINNDLGNEQDLKLHLKIAELSKNTTILHILTLILTSDNSYTTFALVSSSMDVDPAEWHSDIVAAIEKRNPEEAGESMYRHLVLLEEGIKGAKEI